MAERIVVWFSSGAASALAGKIAVEAYGQTRKVELVNINMDADEHPDNVRFRRDIECWTGQPIIQIRNQKYQGIDDVFLTERYIAGVTGAACTKRLKREIARAYMNGSTDPQVIGYTADEPLRIARLLDRSQNEHFLWLLADAGITKEDCYHVLSSAGIELPAMYKLGYNNNNCVGCVKGGIGYWNKIRVDFPDIFKRRALIEREIGFPILRDVWLDELDPNAGRDVPVPRINCGLFCESYQDLIPLAIEKGHLR